jgi:hypothetical protein
MARHVADIKRGRKSVEEKAEAIGSFVTSFLLETVWSSTDESRAVLPPVSRLRASLEAPQAARPKPTPAPAFVEEAAAECCAAPLPTIQLKPPITVKQLTAKLGLKPHQIIAELMTFNIFANINQTIDPDVASTICENHGFVLEKERREEAATVQKKIEKVPIPIASSRVMEEAATITSLEEVIHKLHTKTILFLDTADRIAAPLREYDLEWSPAVIVLCKAFENEAKVRLLVPLRRKTRGRDLKADISDEDFGRIARFCSTAGAERAICTVSAHC